MINKFRFFEGIIENEFVFDNLGSINIQEGIRTLRATWAPELEEEINAYHAIDAEAELSRLMSEQIAEEVDRDIVRRLTGIWNGGIRA